MAGRGPPQTAVVVNSLIGDLVQDAVNEPLKLSEQPSTCRRLFDILGFQPADEFEDDEDPATGSVMAKSSSCTLQNTPNPALKQRNWHSWMTKALAEGSSDDEVEVFKKPYRPKVLETTGVQTEQPRLRRQEPEAVPVNASEGQPGSGSGPAPCELTRQTIFIDAVAVPIPNVLGRAPLADRFCYMLTDFASALYCSLAIMCCCTPNMLR
ncbi:uncharacterized protein [Drosophila bipectinata]|uniref:uncharacterized protein n=1 Tax=Drosophila bipectinata TaxID=42026 RepID=UPI001C8AB7DB|nr:uncharacterized protein LOC108131264 [Drosophila bipectinata]